MLGAGEVFMLALEVVQADSLAQLAIVAILEELVDMILVV